MSQNFNIHISNLISTQHDLKLNPENVTEKLDTCADQMARIAEIYRRVAGLLRDKQMQILEAEGSAESGCFTLDEIDAGRLRQAGAVVDHTSQDSKVDYSYPFFIDPWMDEALRKVKNISQTIQESISDPNLAPPIPAEAALSNDDEDDVPEGMVDELTEQFKKLDFSQGEVDYQASFNAQGDFQVDISVPDNPADDLPEVSFDPDTSEFYYKCGGCDKTHTAGLNLVCQSLRLAMALLNNMSKSGNSILHQSLTVIQNDLRLLEFLVKKDYQV